LTESPEPEKFIDGFPVKTLIKWHKRLGKTELTGKWKEKAEKLGLPTKIEELERLV